MKVLIIDDEPEIREILASILEAEINCDVVLAESGNKAVKVLEEHQDIDLILSDYTMPDGGGGVVYNYNVKHKNLPFIFVSGGYLEDYEDVENFFTSNDKNAYIHKPIDIDTLVRCVNEASQGSSQVCEEASPRYARVRKSILDNYSLVGFELFLKLGDEKFVKIKNRDEEFSIDHKKYQGQDARSLYLEHRDFIDYMSSVIQSHSMRLNADESQLEKVELCGVSLEIMQSALIYLGMNSQQMLLVNTTIESMMDLLLKTNELRSHIRILLESKGYYVSHSITSAHLSFLIANKIGLGQESIISKLVSAALLHDITLANSELCKFKDLEAKEYKELDLKSRKMVKEHPSTCSELLFNSDKVAQDVLTIVREHHELPNGKGFPRGLNQTTMSGLSLIYSAALKMADHLFFYGHSKESLQDFVEVLRRDGFEQGSAKKVFDGVLEIIEDKAQ